MTAYYQIQYRKPEDRPDTWHRKCNCPTQAQAEKFIEVLENVSNVYIELRVVPVQDNEQDKQ